MNNEPVDYPPLKAGGIIENNEPVAFWNKDFDLWEENAIQTYKADGWNIPLYTHPAKTIWCACGDGITPDSGAVCGVCVLTNPAKEHFEDEPQAEELHEILQSHLDLTDEEFISVYTTWCLTSNGPLVLKLEQY